MMLGLKIEVKRHLIGYDIFCLWVSDANKSDFSEKKKQFGQ